MRKQLWLLLFILGIGPPVWAGTCTVSDVTSTQIASETVSPTLKRSSSP